MLRFFGYNYYHWGTYMKWLLILTTALLFSLSSWAFVDGEYTCGSRAEEFLYTYKITTLTINGVDLPYLEVTNTIFSQDGTPDKTHTVKGFPTHLTNSAGEEMLLLGNVNLNLTAGRPSCGL